MIGLWRITGEYSGFVFVELLFTVTETYRCTESLGFVVFDNVSNMDILIFKIERQLITVGIDWSVDYYRIRCFGYIIHLVVEAFLFGDEDMSNTEDREIWRCFGCFGKIHNIVVWV